VPRPLSIVLDAAMTAERRSPRFRVDIYDLRSTEGEASEYRINDVVRSNVGESVVFPAIVGPRKFTDVTEVAGDYIDQGVAATTVSVRVMDPRGTLDPVSNAPSAGDPDADGRWLRQRNVVVIREGDATEDESSWPITFTGKIQGQPSQDRNRTTGRSELVLKCASREVDYLRYANTSVNFPQGTSFLDMILSLATVSMGLDSSEIAVSGLGVSVTQFRSTQFVLESPLVSIAKIMFAEGFMPRFLGNGQLGTSNGIITKGPVRTYTSPTIIRELTRPMLEFNGTNHVTVKGLDPDLSRIVQGVQEIARA